MSIVLLEHPRPRPPERYESVVNTPLSACLMTGYIASTLISRHLEVNVVDANLNEWSFAKMIQELEKRSFKLLGVHFVYLWEYTGDMFKALLSLKKKLPDIHINLYGHFPTFASGDLLAENPFVDSITIGEPEGAFLELAESIVNNKGHSALLAINGLAFNAANSKADGVTVESGVVQNRPGKPVSDLDKLPFPYRNDFKQKKKKGISTYILASRGCYGKCTFCYLDNFYGDESYWRGRSPENIFKEICNIYENYGEKYFYFADANFFGPGRNGKERACQLANLIVDKELNINFGIECRVNDVEEKTISALVKAGLKEVFLGIESGSQRSLDKFRKYTTVEDNKNAIYLLREYGIEPNYGFIMFDPDSTITDVRENFEFLKEMNMLRTPSITAHLLHHKQTIFKGTFDFEQKYYGPNTDSGTMYECSYEFKDKSVKALSDDINSFCLKSLRDLFRNRDEFNVHFDSCVYEEDDLFSRQMNKKLIDHFEMALKSFEDNPVFT
ncbi:Fe-S oxidoreductase [Candidatus Scalindua japonica]|uniref:Fe-S oxidoreductase n=1 Tax=Candidatus Scalindua japonica TaxID=1284222 RepID=A0A286TUJ2_9BACT|nr:radical SAM protein [Candidatus Scalindua japonica]GAX59524.1 Fe-S oxidoreductase [Candidatus Scalindua japonica]